MRGALAWIIAIVAGVLVVIVVTAMIGNRDKSGETVPAGEWAQSVCGAVAVWRGEIESIVEDIRTPNASSTAGGEEPQSETPQGRTGFVRKGLERAVQATETMVTGIENAGAPDTPQGERGGGAGLRLGRIPLSTISRRRRTRSTTRLTRSRRRSTQVTGAAGAIGSTLTSGVQDVRGRRRVSIRSSQPRLQDSSTCQQLREEES